ncbi:MAG: Dynamin-like GTPase that mediates homotypic ER fusion [Cyphobasidiales sp. Tagirdzhanova-0007]|nr:MAG: Dynamin-like GTPase that mediates homotypic ER fusion [Cyphobasidiales sp. Tagirdzhanova-0007]
MQDFERKSALFSMATAEVLIVNLWEHQIGLYQGANMGLLKTVLEVNLGLFQASKAKTANVHKDKALLLFVIRDHIGATPLANLAATLKQDIHRLWDGLLKPEGLENSQMTDFFDLDFTALPHKLLQPDQFEQQVLELRARFVDPKDPSFAFKPAYHKRIPADGFAPYLSGIWEQVLANKDLDLPTQQELLAQFRCDEIATTSFEVFEAQILAYRKPIDSGSVFEGLGPGMAQTRSSALAQFDAAASRYHVDVYQRKRTELLAKMNSSLSPLFVGQLKNVHKMIVKKFKATIAAELKAEGYDFGGLVKQAHNDAESYFIEQAQLIQLDNTDWQYEEAHIQLKEELAAIADTLRAEETKKMVVLIERNVKKKFLPSVELALNKPSPSMWDMVLKAFKEALDKADNIYLRKAKKEENEHALALLRKRSWLSLRAVVDEQTADAVMLIKLKLAFEDKFRYDADGVPRVWRPADDIDTAFRAAKEETLALIPLYSKIAPSDPSLSFSMPDSETNSTETLDDVEFDFSTTLVVLSEAKQIDLADRFRRESDAYYVEAKRSMVSSISQIPYWMYAVIGILGWNEFIAVIKNPIYFTLLILAAAGAYITVQLNMVGPVTTLAKGVSREVYKVANDTLREHFSAPAPSQMERPHRATADADARDESNFRRRTPSSEAENIMLKKLD